MGDEQVNLAPNSEDQGGYGYGNELVWNPSVREYLSKAYGAEQFAKICLALTRPCITSTVRVNTQHATTKEVMEQLRRHLLKTSALHTEASGNQSKEISPDVSVTRPPFKFSDIAEFGGLCRNADDQNCEGESDITPEGTDDKSNGESFPNDPCWEHPVLKDVVMVRGRGPCTVDCGDDTDGPTRKEVIVSRKCAEAVLRGANVYVPGLLACSLHVEKGDEVAVTAAVEKPDPSGGWSVRITRGTTIGSEHGKAQLEDPTRKGWFIGKGRAVMSRAALFKETRGLAIEMTARVFDLPPFHGLLKGQIFLQNLPSIVAARVLDPRPGERILDMCAAPGGKTTAIAIIMKDKGEVVALDRSHQKVLDIKRLAEEMMLTCIRAYKIDATKAVQKSNTAEEVGSSTQISSQNESIVTGGSQHKELGAFVQAPVRITATQPDVENRPTPSNKESSQQKSGAYLSQAAVRKQARRLKNMTKRGQIGETSQQVTGFRSHSFDKVLLDAPCSALGLRPRLFSGEETLESLRSHACYQRKMIDQAVQLVRPGGILVYSTCTMNPGENEALVRYALDMYNFLSLVPQDPRIGGPGLVGGLDVFDGMSCKEWLREEEKNLVQRFCPAGPHDTIGFFIAKFVVASQSDPIKGSSIPANQF